MSAITVLLMSIEVRLESVALLSRRPAARRSLRLRLRTWAADFSVPLYAQHSSRAEKLAGTPAASQRRRLLVRSPSKVQNIPLNPPHLDPPFFSILGLDHMTCKIIDSQ